MHRFYDSLLNNLMLSNKNSLLEADLKKKKKYIIGLFGVSFLLWFFSLYSEGINKSFRRMINVLKLELYLLRKSIFSFKSGITALSAREKPSYEEQVNLSNKSLLHQSVILLLSFFDPICLQVFHQDF